MSKSSEVHSKVRVNRMFTRSGELRSESSDEEEISVSSFKTNPAEVTVTLGLTINLGDFNSARIDVSCRVPAYVEEVEEAYQFAYNFAEDKLKQEADTVRGIHPKAITHDDSPL